MIALIYYHLKIAPGQLIITDITIADDRKVTSATKNK